MTKIHSTKPQIMGLLDLPEKKWRSPTEEPGGVLREMGTDRGRSFGVKRFGWR